MLAKIKITIELFSLADLAGDVFFQGGGGVLGALDGIFCHHIYRHKTFYRYGT